jgi:arginine deiminase
VPGFSGVDSEVGRLRAVIVHRPGAELKRVLPRHAGQLLFAGLPWAARAQQEHDIFTQVLRDHGVQVLYLTELLQDVLEYAPARQQAITAALGSVLLGDELAGPAGTVRYREHQRAGQRAVRSAGRTAQPVLPGQPGSGAASGRLTHRTLRMRSA